MSLPAPIAALLGLLLVALTLFDALETMLVPRRIGRRVRLTRYFYLLTWRGWRALARRLPPGSAREAVLGLYGPFSLLGLLVCWATGLIAGFAFLQHAARPVALTLGQLGTLFYMSGETFFTLGFGDVVPATGLGRLLSVCEAGMGFGFLGTVIGYLPTLYGAFSAREVEISLFDARAGSPPSAAEFLARRAATEPGATDAMLRDWERWAAQLLETHISYPLLMYYRSQHVNQSWLAALTAMLDSTALILAGTDGMPHAQAKLTFAMARHALVDLTQIFVRRPLPACVDRLPPAELARVRERLRDTPAHLSEEPATVERLAELRRSYEPYAQALAAHLLVELPTFAPIEGRRDNWRGGPWDKGLGGSGATLLRDDEHF